MTNSDLLRQELARRATQGDAVAEKSLARQAKDPIRSLMESMRPAIEQAVPRHIDPNRLTRILLTTVRTNAKLREAALRNKESRDSLLAAIMVVAQLGLEPGPLGQVHIVPFENRKKGCIEAQVIVDYKGYLDLARRSGEIESITVEPVCENDHFEYELGLSPKLVHRPALQNRGRPYLYYGVVRFRSGGYQMAVLTLDEIEQHRKRSRAANDGPWVTDYDAMCRKTVVRHMWRWLPISVDDRRASYLDESVATGIDENRMISVTPDYAAEGEEPLVLDVEAEGPQQVPAGPQQQPLEPA